MRRGNYDQVDDHGSVETFSCTPLPEAEMDGGIGFHVGSGWWDASGDGFVLIDAMTLGQPGMRVALRHEKARALAHLILAAAGDVERGIKSMQEGENEEA